MKVIKNKLRLNQLSIHSKDIIMPRNYFCLQYGVM